jgi:hypothetical protein
LVEREALLDQIEKLRAPAPRLEFDKHYGFGGNQMQEWCSHASGFGRGEPPGIWTVAAAARLRLGAPAEYLDSIVLTISLRAFLPPARPELNVDVSVAGLRCARWSFTKPGRADRKIVIPGEAIGPDGEIWLRLDIDDPRSPAECGTGSDTRALGIMLHSLMLQRGERGGSAMPSVAAAPS